MTNEERKVLVERLQDFTCVNCGHDWRIHDEAADQIEADGQRIEALEAENERLRNILEQWLATAREHLDTEVAGRTFEVLRGTK